MKATTHDIALVWATTYAAVATSNRPKAYANQAVRDFMEFCASKEAPDFLDDVDYATVELMVLDRLRDSQ